MIFVTGGAGFIGSHLVRRLVERGDEVSVLIKQATDTSRIADLIPRLKVFYGDLNDAVVLARIARDAAPSAIYHLAASTIRSGIAAADDEVVRTNFLGTVNLIKALADIPYRSFVHAGSFLEYKPAEVYSISKLSATLYGQAVAAAAKKPILTLRTFTPYGPGMQKGRLVYEVINKALKNEPIELTSPSITRDFIFVEDLVDLYIECINKAHLYPGAVFNAGTGRATTLEALVDIVLKKIGSTSTMKWGALPNVSYDSDRWQADMEKTFAAFAWRPKHMLEEGIEKTIVWLKNQL
jgi:dolichol-phosphate mannosyltransferase